MYDVPPRFTAAVTEEPTDTSRRAAPPAPRAGHGPGYALFLVVFVALAAQLIQRSPVRAFEVISRSMVPTIVRGDRVVALAWDLFARAPAPGDLVTFHPPTWIGADPPVVKRVVATGGDVVAIHDGGVFVNDRRLLEPYARAYAPGYRYGPLQVPPGTVFVLGDNRRISEDSTTFGPVPIPRLDAMVWLRWAADGSVCSLAGTFPGMSEC